MNLPAKWVGVGGWIRDRSELDSGEPVDIVFYVSFHPLVISLLQISQGVLTKPVKIDGVFSAMMHQLFI